MFALQSRFLRRRLSAPTSGSARRRARERRLAEQTRAEGERLARERRDQRLREKIEQQRQAREELASYEPWGRAGGGAPNPCGPRYCDLRTREIYPEDELKGLSLHEPIAWWGPRRARRRSRASRRDSQRPTGSSRRSVDENRSRQPAETQHNHIKALDEVVDPKKTLIKHELRRDSQVERKTQGMDAVWGRPGPGGTIWRNPRNIGLNFSKSMGWTDNEIFDKLKGEQKRSKGSSLTLPKVKRDEDSPSKEHKQPNKPSSVEKLPDITATNSSGSSGEGNGKKPKKNNKARSPKKKFVKRLSNGVVTKVIADDNGVETEAYNGSNGPQLTPEETILRITGGVELVPLLARRRRVGARTLPSSDVTRPPEQPCQWREILNVDYLRELKNQMHIKYQQQEESRRDSAESCLKHHDTWASLWGRPGHGAPQLRGRYARNNLARLLYVPPVL